MLNMRRALDTILATTFVVGFVLVPTVHAEEATKPEFDLGGYLKVDGFFIQR